MKQGLGRMERILYASLLLILLLAMIRSSAQKNVPPVIEASQFIVRDSDGTVRSLLGIQPDGKVGLLVNDKHGRSRCTIGIDKMAGSTPGQYQAGGPSA